MDYRHIVCGIDLSDESLVAACQAVRLGLDGAQVTLVGVEVVLPAAGMVPMSPVLVTPRSALQEMEKRVAELVGDGRVTDSIIRTGSASMELEQEARARSADLVAIGSHGTGRLAGIALGSTATYVLHDVPCSVLIGRPAEGREGWPRSLVVGVDGSNESLEAYHTARALAERFGVPLRTIVSEHGTPGFVLAEARKAIPDHEATDVDPVDALVAASKETDLVVVGSRGLKGLAALGSVSERVAHKADSSVLVVRAAYA
jgi:nucleotide-binding universal stress UspA family protein